MNGRQSGGRYANRGGQFNFGLSSVVDWMDVANSDLSQYAAVRCRRRIKLRSNNDAITVDDAGIVLCPGAPPRTF